MTHMDLSSLNPPNGSIAGLKFFSEARECFASRFSPVLAKEAL